MGDGSIVDAATIHSVSWTLLHFLWQGCVVAGAAATGLALLRKWEPRVRYAWLILCLIVLIIAPAATFAIRYSTRGESEEAGISASGTSTDQRFPPVVPSDFSLSRSAPVVVPSETTASENSWQMFHLAIVGSWIVGQLLLGSRIWLSALFVYRIQRLSQPVERNIRKRAEQLARRLGMQCPVIATSTRVAGAMAAGFGRRMVLLPTAWLCEMSPEMLEAVIAHELAHLRRHDLWVNLVQRLVESMLFFHPTVWWLSSKIRQERELCCDHIAVQVTRKELYAKTLEHVARRALLPSGILVTQMGDDRMSLLRRVHFVLEGHVGCSSGWWPAGLLASAIPCVFFFASQPTPSLAEGQSVVAWALESATQEKTRPGQPIELPVAAPTDEVIRRSDATRTPNALKNSPKWILGDYIIEPPDVLLIEVANHSDVSGEHLVGPDGVVNLGIYGRVNVAGMTIEKARGAIESCLKKSFEEPTITLDVAATHSKVMYVIRKEGGKETDFVHRIPVTGNETVLDAVVQAGGLSADSDIYICRPSHRDGNQSLQIDWAAITERGETSTNYQLLPGDRLFIVEKSNHDSPSNIAHDLTFSGVTLTKRIPIMGSMQSGGSASILEPPSDNDILEIIRVGVADSPLLRLENRDRVHVEKTLLAEYVDPPRHYPLIGSAQMHHAHYKCTVSMSGQKNDETTAPEIADTSHVFYIDHTHLHAGDVSNATEDRAASFTTAYDENTTEVTNEVYTACYQVADLVCPLAPPKFTRTGKRERQEDAKADFDTLIELIQSTVTPDSWEAVGGSGAIAPFESNLSIVVTQTQSVHDEIVDLLAQLRRLQETQVVFNATDLELPSSLLQRLGLHGKHVAVLNAEEQRSLLTEAEADPLARAFPGLKATVFNGQLLAMDVPSENGDGTEKLEMQGVIQGGPIRISAVMPRLAITLHEDHAILVRTDTGSTAKQADANQPEAKQRFRLITVAALQTSKDMK